MPHQEPSPLLPDTARMGADEIADAIAEENRALEEALSVSRKRFAGIRDLASSVAGRLDLDELLRTIVGKVGELCDCDRATLFVIDEQRQELWSRVIEGASETIRMPIGSGIAGFVARAGIALNLPNAYDDVRFNPAVDESTGYRTRSILAVPVLSPDGKVVGVVEALNKRIGPFGVEDERVLEAITSQISVALKNAFLFEALKEKAAHLERAQATLQRRVSELDLLVEIEGAFSRADSPAELVDAVVGRARQLLAADAALVALIDLQTGHLRIRASHVDGREFTLPRQVPVDTGLVGASITTEEVINVADANSDGRYAKTVGEELGLSAGPFLVAPLYVNGRAHGAVGVMRQTGRDVFSADDERILALLGGRVAVAIDEARRREKSKNEAHLERLGTMLAGIVHDLKTPMTVISGYVQLMALENDAEERQRNSETVLKNCEQITSMIKELMQFVRGETSVLIRKSYLQTFMADVEDMVRRLAANRKGIIVSTKLGYRGALRMDDLKMKRALANLCKNSLEAMGETGELHVSVEQIGDVVEFAVKDTGPGLPQEIESRLFEQFATHGKKEGTGLGLALVKKIVDDHHGEVRVESRRGEGCTFRLRVPL